MPEKKSNTEMQKPAPEKGTPAWRKQILSVIPVDPGINTFYPKNQSCIIVRNSSSTTITAKGPHGQSIIYYVDNNGKLTGARKTKGLEFGDKYRPEELNGIAKWLDDALEKSAAEIKEKFQPQISPEIAGRRNQVQEETSEAMNEIDPNFRPKKLGGTSDIIAWGGDK